MDVTANQFSPRESLSGSFNLGGFKVQMKFLWTCHSHLVFQGREDKLVGITRFVRQSEKAHWNTGLCQGFYKDNPNLSNTNKCKQDTQINKDFT